MISALGSALPPALDAHISRTSRHGAAPLPNVPLNTEVPTRGPVVLDLGGAFDLAVYTGPRMWFTASPAPASQVDTSA